jgi:hypothetical protein
MNSISDAVKSAYGRLSKTTKIALLVLFIMIPDWLGRGNFWYTAVLRAWPSLKAAYASPYVKVSLLLLALAAIVLDQRRLARKAIRERDLNTLQGKTLQLRDEMRLFVDSHPQPLLVFRGTSRERTFDRPSTSESQRLSKLEHGYCLKFADRVARIHHEFGERGVQDYELTETLLKAKYGEPGTYTAIIDALSRLAHCPEASQD